MPAPPMTIVSVSGSNAEADRHDVGRAVASDGGEAAQPLARQEVQLDLGEDAHASGGVGRLVHDVDGGTARVLVHREGCIGMSMPATRSPHNHAMLGDATSTGPGPPVRAADGGALDPLVGPQCSLAVQLRRATGAVIGRSTELDAIAAGDPRGQGPPRRGHPRGRAGHRQDAAPARRGRARGGGRLHLRRDHGRRGDPRAVPGGAQPVRVGRDPRRRPRGRRRRPRCGGSSMPSPAATSPGSRASRRTPSSCARSTSRASRSRRSPGSARSRCSSTTSSGPTTTPCGCSGTSSGATPTGRSSCC